MWNVRHTYWMFNCVRVKPTRLSILRDSSNDTFNRYVIDGISLDARELDILALIVCCVCCGLEILNVIHKCKKLLSRYFNDTKKRIRFEFDLVPSITLP